MSQNPIFGFCIIARYGKKVVITITHKPLHSVWWNFVAGGGAREQFHGPKILGCWKIVGKVAFSRKISFKYAQFVVETPIFGKFKGKVIFWAYVSNESEAHNNFLPRLLFLIHDAAIWFNKK